MTSCIRRILQCNDRCCIPTVSPPARANTLDPPTAAVCAERLPLPSRGCFVQHLLSAPWQRCTKPSSSLHRLTARRGSVGSQSRIIYRSEYIGYPMWSVGPPPRVGSPFFYILRPRRLCGDPNPGMRKLYILCMADSVLLPMFPGRDVVKRAPWPSRLCANQQPSFEVHPSKTLPHPERMCGSDVEYSMLRMPSETTPTVVLL